MNRRLSNESASLNFNINIPSGVVREYFDGLAKVEAAKPKPQSSSFDWSSLASIASMLIPLLSQLSSDDSTNICSPKAKPKTKAVKVKLDGDDVRGILKHIIDTQLADDKDESSDDLCEEDVCQGNICKAETPEEDKPKENKSEEDKSKEDKPGEKVEAKEDKLKIRPVYDDDELPQLKHFNGGSQLNIDMNNMGGFGDMMKMFMPMMQGIVGEMGEDNKIREPKPKQPKQENSDKTEVEEEQTPEPEGKQEVKIEDEPMENNE